MTGLAHHLQPSQVETTHVKILAAESCHFVTTSGAPLTMDNVLNGIV